MLLLKRFREKSALEAEIPETKIKRGLKMFSQ